MRRPLRLEAAFKVVSVSSLGLVSVWSMNHESKATDSGNGARYRKGYIRLLP